MKIEFENVNFSYAKKSPLVLKNINLRLEKNEIVFVMGPTGSGKSTLISHINGLLFANGGNVVINSDDKTYIVNKNLKNINDVRKNIGMVFQNPENQLFESNVLKDVMFGPLNFKKSEEEAKLAAFKALKLMGLDAEIFEKSPFNLSGGEKRKVAIAGVLSYSPNVFVFDEPTSNLDYKSSQDFLKIIKELAKEGKVVIVSHDQNLAYEYADRIIVINDGEIVKDGTYKEIFKDLELLNKVNIEIPFVENIKQQLKIDNDARSIKELASYLRGENI